MADSADSLFKMDISENDSQGGEESGDFPSLESSNSVSTSVESVIKTEEQESEKKRRKHLAVYWNRPIAKVYDDNFGFSVNGYQPMIDYLDAKDSGRSVKRGEVHLPFIEERCLNRYSSHNPFKYYDNRDIDRYILKGERIRTQIRQNDAAGASNVLRRTHSNWSMTKKYVQLVKNSYVIDHRKSDLNSESDFKRVYQFPIDYPLLDIMATYLKVDPVTAGRVSQRRIETQTSLIGRRSRLNELDKQFNEAMKNMTRTVDEITQPASAVTGAYGQVMTQDALTTADDMVLRNRYRREEDMHALDRHVDRLTRFDETKYRLPTEVSDRGVRTALSSLRKKQANTLKSSLGAKLGRIEDSRSIKQPYTSIEDLDDDFMLDYLVRKQKTRPHAIEDYNLPLKALTPRAETISDVQERVISRAREMTGDTSETRRIKERAKYLNVTSPAPRKTDFNLMVLPTRLEKNIDHMAVGLATSGRAIRKYDVDYLHEDLVDPPVNESAYRIMGGPEKAPVDKPSSDYARVRSAECRARERTAVLGL